MFFSSKKLLGLDIGTNTIKIAEVDVSKGGAVMQSFGYMPTPVNSMAPEEIKDVSALGSAISNLISEIRTKRKNVCAGLSGTSVIVRKITMPKLDGKLLKEQIKFEAEQYIPFDINNISLTHVVLPSLSQGSTMDLLLVAAQNEIITQYLATIENANLKSGIFDVTGFALANVFEYNYGRIKDQNIGLFNFGSSVTNFIVISQGDIVFCRDILVGGVNYTSEISKNLGISFVEAEALKISASSKKEVPEDVVNYINFTTESIIEEIKNSLDLLNVSTNGLTLNRCFFTGGACQTLGLVDLLIKSTGIPFEVLNPFKRIQANAKKFSSAYVKQISNFSPISLGLALREDSDHDPN